MPNPVSAFGQHSDATPTLKNGDTVPLQLDSAGNVLVNVAVGGGGTGSNAAAGPTAALVPADADYTGLISTLSYPTPVSAGQLVGGMGDKAGRQIFVPNAPRSMTNAASAQSSSASPSTLIAAGGAGVYNDILTLILTNESTTTATVVSLSDGTNTYKFALSVNGGGVFQFPTPLPASSAATAWQFSNSAGVAVDCVVIYVGNQ